MISIAQVRFISWKYWYAPYVHALSIAVIAVYGMYTKYCDGELDTDWRIDADGRMSFQEFRLSLSEQMLKYNPKDNLYPGDHKFRAYTRRPKQTRHRAQWLTSTYVPDGVTVKNFKRAKVETRHRPPRLCGDLDHLWTHLVAIKNKLTEIRVRCVVKKLFSSVLFVTHGCV